MIRHSSDVQQERGPYVIIGRPHSGSRLLAHLFIVNGVFLGSDLTQPFLDSTSWYQRFTVPLVASRYFPHWPEAGSDPEYDAFCSERIQDCRARYWHDRQPEYDQPAWGWKYCESLFVMLVIKSHFPAARFIHIIRDGRDVWLSDRGFFQLTGSHQNPPGWDPALVEGRKPTYYEFCQAVTFGDRERNQSLAIDITDRRALVENRFLLQAQSWVTCVNRARQYGSLLLNDYLEIRYEDLCRNPGEQMRRLFDWTGLPLKPAVTLEFTKVTTVQLGKWRRAPLTNGERRDFQRAVKLAQPLLTELGYDDG